MRDRSNRHLRTMLIFSVVVLLLAACAKSPTPQPNTQPQTPPVPKPLTLATTTSTVDSGLLEVLIPAFEAKHPYKVKVLSKGTGEAMEIGKRGDADVLLVHARASEDQFVADGYGVDRRDVMYNDFVVLGPANDPAGIKGTKNATDAFKKIASTSSTFISRGDKSGTHQKELALWGLAKVTPEGKWYISSGVGMGDAIRMATEKQGYILSDRATYLSWKAKTDLSIAVEGDKDLFNPYGVIAVNPAKHASVNYEGAKAFTNYIISPEGQKLIGEFGKDKYGAPLFFPSAK